jgi:hypothetical protein
VVQLTVFVKSRAGEPPTHSKGGADRGGPDMLILHRVVSINITFIPLLTG